MQYTHDVILSAPYCGATHWGCLSLQHARNLKADFVARGLRIVAIKRRK